MYCFVLACSLIREAQGAHAAMQRTASAWGGEAMPVLDAPACITAANVLGADLLKQRRAGFVIMPIIAHGMGWGESAPLTIVWKVCPVKRTLARPALTL